MRHLTQPPSRFRFTRLAALACALALARPAFAVALPVHAGAGADYSTAPGDETTRGVLGFATIEMGAADALGAVMRYDDSRIGAGTGLTGGLGFGLGPMTRLRTTGTRYVGDGDFRGWRVKVGPQVSTPGGASLGLFFTHDDNNVAGRSNGAVGEAEFPVAPRVSGRLNASYTSLGDGVSAVSGAAGAGVALPAHLSLAGEVGLAQTGAQGQSFPRSRGLGDLVPLVGGGGGSGSSSDRPFSTTVALSIRAVFP